MSGLDSLEIYTMIACFAVIIASIADFLIGGGIIGDKKKIRSEKGIGDKREQH